VGARVIVGFPNFATLSTRVQLGLLGRTPVTQSLPYEWHDTPNLHFLSIKDFIIYSRKTGITIERSFYFNADRRVALLPNLRAETAIFVVRKSSDD
jgi:methionine biosynthesis protein MetW